MLATGATAGGRDAPAHRPSHDRRRTIIPARAVPESLPSIETPDRQSGYRDALAARRSSYVSRLEHLQLAAAELAEEPQSVEAPDDDDLGEADGANVERDRALALIAAAREALEAVDAALVRLDTGTYGRCAGCGNEIPEGRLEAVPEATHCVACKTGGLRLGPGWLARRA